MVGGTVWNMFVPWRVLIPPFILTVLVFGVRPSILHVSFLKVLVETVSLPQLVLDAYILSILSPQNQRQFYKRDARLGFP